MKYFEMSFSSGKKLRNEKFRVPSCAFCPFGLPPLRGKWRCKMVNKVYDATTVPYHCETLDKFPSDCPLSDLKEEKFFVVEGLDHVSIVHDFDSIENTIAIYSVSDNAYSKEEALNSAKRECMKLNEECIREYPGLQDILF